MKFQPPGSQETPNFSTLRHMKHP